MTRLNHTIDMGGNIPRGWTSKIADQDKVETMLSQCTSLPDIHVKLYQTHGDLYLFESGAKYFLWNAVTEDAAQVTRPTEFDELLRQIDADITKVETIPVSDE